MTELAKTFDPAEIEARWYAHWEETNAFRPERPGDPPFTIVMPPPNVTGSLHIGHALDVTLQDILVRHARLQGKDALWVAGTDHAGIATQMVVERRMAENGDKRANYTRDAFVEKVWDWKRESGGTITQQLRRLGASCDWENERFTMDAGFSKAVIKVFVDLYNEGLLYRDKRLVNWDPGLKTAISDLEVETREVQGKFWHFRYPLADGSGHISVATTRPETMLADMAVAVNPADERYTAMVGKMVRLPITGRLIPIVTDDHADPELGSGAVKITPGHDFNDFEVGKRAGFAPADMLNMFDGEGRVVQCGGIPDEFFLPTVSEHYAPLGIDRFEARKLVVGLMEKSRFLERVEDRVIQTPYGDRSGVVIEPWLTDQWYVDAKTLAGPAIEAVRSGAIKVVPQSWEKTWFQWLENIQPWCVSRQLWWGHQIPVWYGPAREGKWSDEHAVRPVPFVAIDHADLLRQARAYYAEDDHDFAIYDGTDDYLSQPPSLAAMSKTELVRDDDVLDTWFSSALWPFGTLGWPDANPKLAKHYPNDVLISGFDILFFWDARMAMQGLHFMKPEAPLAERVPWKTLYLHGLVRAPDGSKMSKSKGNAVDPLGLIDQYGADALRFTLAAMESQGRDIKLDEKRVEGYRNFATKLWNAARFLQGNGVGASASVAAPAATLAVNKWIIGEVVETLAKLDQAIADLRYDAMADAIYHFAWGTFCDWYIELIKPTLQVAKIVDADGHGPGAPETRAVASWVFDQILVMLHPFMPFITEELWHAMGGRSDGLIQANWPNPNARVDKEAKHEVDWLIGILQNVRSIRAELSIAPGLQIIIGTDGLKLSEAAFENLKRLFARYGPTLARIGKIESFIFFNTGIRIQLESGQLEDRTDDRQTVPGSGRPFGVAGVDYIFGLEGVIDLDAERARLTKGIEAATKEADSVGKRLDNPAFVEKAKPEAIAKARADHAEKSAEAERLRAALARLG